jgi:hypothetical protein
MEGTALGSVFITGYLEALHKPEGINSNSKFQIPKLEGFNLTMQSSFSKAEVRGKRVNSDASLRVQVQDQVRG